MTTRFPAKHTGCVETTSNASQRKEHHPNEVRNATEPTFFGVYRQSRKKCARFAGAGPRRRAFRSGGRRLTGGGMAHPAPMRSGSEDYLEYRSRNPVWPDVFNTDSDGGNDDDYHYRL
ncbi:hypothetical protein [Rhizobium binae]|uniref:hypothetical protein n=1 Tax=Rhizobium binae TaxID=1138190 RepID=UPI001C8362F9|nr:hypothetical protein [Rhizobium binae]MBX4971118.1 hypothetical protein [Rhizobium binae]